MISRIVKRVCEEVTKGYFTKLVKHAYEDQNSLSRIKTVASAKRWYGLEKVEGAFARMKAKWEVDFIKQVQLELFEKGYEQNLNISYIGFKDLKIYCSSRDSNSSSVYLFGFSDNLTYFDIYKRYIRPGTVALDVGANLGIHTLVMSLCVSPDGYVHSFEALKHIFERHVENLALNSVTNVNPHNHAIGAESGAVNFDANLADFNIGKGRVNEGGTVQVQMVVLDEFEKSLGDLTISLIKIDIEGQELNALKGAQSLLKKHYPVIVCEFNAHKYGLHELLDLIPFSCKIFRVPQVYYETLEELNKDSSEACDILILPEGM